MDADQKESLKIKEKELALIADKIETFYWVPFLKTPFGSLEEVCGDIDNDCEALSTVFKTFTTNLISIEKMLMLPYVLISTDILSEVDKPGGIGREMLLKKDSESYRQYLLDFAKIGLSKGSIKFPIHKNELNQLMFQASILIWSALENYCKDIFIKILNQSPQLYKKIKNDNFLKEKLSISQSSWERLLEQHNYDLNGKLGYILANNKDFSSPSLLQKLFTTILTEHPEPPDILNYFEDQRLWLVGQRRHLIVHRLGIVDEEYLGKTNDLNQKLGQKLDLKGKDIADAFSIAAQCAIVLYGASRHLWPRPEKLQNKDS